MDKNFAQSRPRPSDTLRESNPLIKNGILKREEQIVATREKSQWIVLQEYSHTYNTRIQLSRLQRIYRNSIATYDQFKIFNDNEPVKSGEPISFHVDAVTVGSIA